MPEEYNDGPHLVIVQNSMRRRHTRWSNSVLDDPFQLPIRVTLHFFRRQRRNRRRETFRKWNPRVLPVKTVTNNTVVPKCLFAVLQRLCSIRKRIAVVLALHRHMAFCPLRQARLRSSRCCHAAPGGQKTSST